MQASLLRILKTADDIRAHSEKQLGESVPALDHGLRASTAAPVFERPETKVLVESLTREGLPNAAAQRLAEAFNKRAQELSTKFTEIYGRSPLEPSHVEKLYRRTLGTWRDELFRTVATRMGNARQNDSIPQNQQSRSLFNYKSLPLLDAFFSEQQFPSRADKKFLAQKSGMTYRQIHVWFQNRRSRTKKTLKSSLGSSETVQREEEIDDSDEGATDVEDMRSSSSSSRSSSLTLIEDENSFSSTSPFYAYPTPYPPDLRIDNDPFPCRFGNFSCLPKPAWERSSATSTNQQTVPDVSDLTAAFESLSIGNSIHTNGNSSHQPWGLFVPSKKSGCDVNAAYNVCPLRAPLISLVRYPSNHKGLRPCSVWTTDQRHCEIIAAGFGGSSLGLKSSTRCQGIPLHGQRTNATATTSSSSSLRSDTVSSSSQTVERLAKLKKGSKKKSGPPRRVPAGPPVQRKSHATAPPTTDSTALPAADSSSSPRSASLTSDDSPPSLCHSSSSLSPVSSQSPSPLTPVQPFPEEALLPLSALASADAPFAIPQSHSLLGKFPPPLFATSDSTCDFSSKPFMDNAFNFDFPVSPTNASLQPLQLPAELATPTPFPFSYDFTSLTS